MRWAPLALIAAAAGCRDVTIDLRTPLPEGCDVPGAICSLGFQGVGDGGGPLQASFHRPTAIAFYGGPIKRPAGIAADDPPGRELFIADRYHHRIRRYLPGPALESEGTVETVVGTGRAALGAAVPGGDPLETDLREPIAVAYCADDWLYWISALDGRIFGLDPGAGEVVAVAGNVDEGNAVDDAPPDEARFRFLDGVQLTCGPDSVLIVADPGNHVVRALNRSGSTPETVAGVSVPPNRVSIVAGTGVAGDGASGVPATTSKLYEPLAALPLSDGSLVIADTGNERVRRVDAGGIVTVIAGDGGTGVGDGGLAIDAAVRDPSGLAVDESERLLFVYARYRIRAVSLATSGVIQFGDAVLEPGEIDTVAGDGAPDTIFGDGDAGTDQAFGASTAAIAFENGRVYVADAPNNVLRRLDGDGGMAVWAGFAGAQALDGFLAAPSDVLFSPRGELVVAPWTGFLYAVDPRNGAIERLAGRGESPFADGDGGLALDAEVFATAVAAEEDGSILLMDPYWGLVRRIDPGGTISTIAGNGNGGDGVPAPNTSFSLLEGIFADDGILFVADDGTVRAINRTDSTAVVAGVTIEPGVIERIAGDPLQYGDEGDDGPALEAVFAMGGPRVGMATDGRHLFVSDTYNDRIRAIDLVDGTIAAAVGSGVDLPSGGDGLPALEATLDEPRGLAVHRDHLYWVEGASLVRRVRLEPGAVVERVAGGEVTGFWGDGGPALEAQLGYPTGIAVGPDGEIYVTDQGNRIRRIEALP